MKTKRILTLLYISAFTFVLIGYAHAVETTEPNNSLQKRKQTREQLRLERCELGEQKFQAHIGRYENVRRGHLASFNNMKTRLEKFIVRAQERGYDTTKLEEDVEVLGVKIETLSQDMTLFIAKLQESKTHTCGSADGTYAEAVKAAKDQLKIVREDVMDIKTYFRNTIRPDITALKSQRPINSGTEE